MSSLIGNDTDLEPMCEVLPMSSRYSRKEPGRPDSVPQAELLLSQESVVGQRWRVLVPSAVGVGMAAMSKSLWRAARRGPTGAAGRRVCSGIPFAGPRDDCRSSLSIARRVRQVQTVASGTNAWGRGAWGRFSIGSTVRWACPRSRLSSPRIFRAPASRLVSFSAIEYAGPVAAGPGQGSRHDCDHFPPADSRSR